MAKKQEDKSEPIISSIPVPPSDSALVIDLPDGQKLLVGKIETGTVIEVATWRGTGRPDSRTNRLMLGMSNETDIKKSEEAQTEQNKNPKNLKFPKKLEHAISTILRKIIVILKKVASKLFMQIKTVKIKDMKKLDLKILKVAVPKIGRKVQKANNNFESISKEEDFDIDFQRILDEVSQRRVVKENSRSRNKATGTKKSKKKT